MFSPMSHGVRERRLGRYIEGLCYWAVGPRNIGALLRQIIDVCDS